MRWDASAPSAGFSNATPVGTGGRFSGYRPFDTVPPRSVDIIAFAP